MLSNWREFSSGRLCAWLAFYWARITSERTRFGRLIRRGRNSVLYARRLSPNGNCNYCGKRVVIPNSGDPAILHDCVYGEPVPVLNGHVIRGVRDYLLYSRPALMKECPIRLSERRA